MNLNPKKCKETLISFLQTDPEVPLLEVNNLPLEKVQTHATTSNGRAIHTKLLSKRLNGCI